MNSMPLRFPLIKCVVSAYVLVLFFCSLQDCGEVFVNWFLILGAYQHIISI